MRLLHALMRGITRLNDLIGRLVSLLILVIFVLLILEIGIRYFMGSPTVWTNELSQMLFGVYAMLAGGYLMAHRGHVNVDIVYGRFPLRTRAVIDVFTAVLSFLFIGALLYFGSSMAWESMSFWERSQSAWDPPIWPIKLSIPVGAGLLLLQLVVKLLQDVMIALGIEPPELLPPDDPTELHT